MTQELEALGRRAVACKHWRWLPGMLALTDGQGWARIYAVQSDGWIRLGGGHPFESPIHTKTPLYPNLSDAATKGAVLAVVREAWQEPCLSVICLSDTPNGQSWGVRSYGKTFASYSLNGAEDGLTEAESLVCALEAAP